MWKLPPRRQPTVLDQSSMVPRRPGAPGLTFDPDGDSASRSGVIINPGGSPGLPSGISVAPSGPGPSGSAAGINLDTGGVLKVVFGPNPPVNVFGGASGDLDWPVPVTVAAWEIISLSFILNMIAGAYGRMALSFDDGPITASVPGNVYWQSSLQVAAGGSSIERVTWYQGATGIGSANISPDPYIGVVPINNRILGGHHIRTTPNVPPVSGWFINAPCALVREWLVPGQ